MAAFQSTILCVLLIVLAMTSLIEAHPGTSVGQHRRALSKRSCHGTGCHEKRKANAKAVKKAKAGHGKSKKGGKSKSRRFHKKKATKAATVATTSGTSANKVGLAWPNGNNDFQGWVGGTSKVSWYYTWSPWNNGGSSEIEFVSMLHDPGQLSDFHAQLKPSKAKIVLGFNEPDQSGQANMSPSYAWQVWKANLAPLRAQGYKLGSPATSSAPDGFTWMQNFVKMCGTDCFDYLILHWYGTDAQAFEQYLQKWYKEFKKPVWVTEYADQNFGGGAQANQAQANAFMKQTTSFMDKTSWVMRYSWFGAMREMQGVNPVNQLMTQSGGLTALGQQYIHS